MQNFTPLPFSADEKSVTVQKTDTFIRAVKTVVFAVQNPLHQDAPVIATRVERLTARISNCNDQHYIKQTNHYHFNGLLVRWCKLL